MNDNAYSTVRTTRVLAQFVRQPTPEQLARANAQTAQSGLPIFYIGAGIAAVLIILVTAAIVMKRSKRSKRGTRYGSR